jgi:hypothetical protein
MRKKKLPISATIIAKDEELKIENCLKSIYSYVDEIIFIHDGPCKDNSLKIAEKYGCNIYIKGYVGEAEPHRNFSYNISKNKWILQIDADESLSFLFQNNLQKYIFNKKYSGYRFKWNIADINQKPRYFYKLVLFRKDKIINFKGLPHEEVKINGLIKIEKDIELIHDRRVTNKQKKHKLNVWSLIHGEKIEDYKFKNIPLIILLFGYFFYPIYNIVYKLINKEITIYLLRRNYIYYYKVWNAFYKKRKKRLNK